MPDSNKLTLTERFVHDSRRHFVMLSCVQSGPEIEGNKALVFSGFLVDIDGRWLFVTAGHILRDVSVAVANGSRFDIWRLSDCTVDNPFRGADIPFHFDPDAWLVICDDALGLDYAAVVLEDLYCLGLRAGGALPMPEHMWADHVGNFEHFAIVGIPSESVSYDGESVIVARITAIPLTRAQPTNAFVTRTPQRFYGQLPDVAFETLRSIDGMSGGPLFALSRVSDGWTLSVIGVQSSWDPNAKVVSACSLVMLTQAIKRAANARMGI